MSEKRTVRRINISGPSGRQMPRKYGPGQGKPAARQQQAQAPAEESDASSKRLIDKNKLIIYDAVMHPKFDE